MNALSFRRAERAATSTRLRFLLVTLLRVAVVGLIVAASFAPNSVQAEGEQEVSSTGGYRFTASNSSPAAKCAGGT